MPTQPDRRTAILERSAVLFARKGVASTSVREIADEVGVLSGSLYHHFPSKDAIVGEILTGYLDELRARYRAVMDADLDPRARLERLIAVSFEMAQARPSATVMYQNEMGYLREQPQYQHVRAAAADVQQTWLAVVEAGRAQGYLRTDIDARVFYRFLRDAMWLSVRWHRPGGEHPAGQLARDCASIFLDGYAVQPAGAQR